MNAKETALEIAEALSDRKAVDVRVLDLTGVSSFTDFFVIASGTSDRHLRALADAAQERARDLGARPLGSEGLRSERWALVDLGDVVVHLFSQQAREFYDLERLWGDADAVDLQAAAGA